MPWRETEPVQERTRFIKDWRSGVWTMRELCDRYAISRKTGYKILHRFEVHGVEGLRDRSRAPHHCPQRTPAETVEAILEARRCTRAGDRASCCAGSRRAVPSSRCRLAAPRTSCSTASAWSSGDARGDAGAIPVRSQPACGASFRR
jgi:hypothetical protein